MNGAPELALEDPAPTTEQLRNLLVCGDQDFKEKFPEPTAQQLVDKFMGERAVTEGADHTKPIDGVPPNEFDWSGDESVVLRSQPATAIYLNDFGQLIIRQEKAWDEENDHVVFISENNATEFLDRLCNVLGVGSFGGPKP